MRTRYVGQLSGALGCMLVALGACGSDDAVIITVPGAEAEVALGSVELPLVTPDSGLHRLRNAVFDIESIAGVPVATLDSELDPDATSLRAELAQGSYRVALRSGWALERLSADGSAERVHAALVSSNPAVVSIRNDRVTQLVFTFTTSTGTVVFGSGTVSIGAAFVEPTSLGSCELVTQIGCNSGQTCLMGDDAGKTFCATAGELEVGAACDSEQCVIGAQCLAVDPAAPSQRECARLCNPDAPIFGCNCLGLAFDEGVGICGPPPANACDLLTQTGCAEGEACQLPGGSFGVCGPPGTVPEGGTCFGEECEAGLDCSGDDANSGIAGTCLRFCDLAAPTCEFCFDVGTAPLGRCFVF